MFPAYVSPDLHLTARLYAVIARESRDELRALLEQVEKMNGFVGHALPNSHTLCIVLNGNCAWPREHVKDATVIWNSRVQKGMQLNDVTATEWPWHGVWLPVKS